MKTMTASEASKSFGQYLDMVQREPVMITKQNRPVAITISMQDVEVLLKDDIEAKLERGLADVEEGRASPMTKAHMQALKDHLKAQIFNP